MAVGRATARAIYTPCGTEGQEFSTADEPYVAQTVSLSTDLPRRRDAIGHMHPGCHVPVSF